ncbi:uncharacterized protein LOC101858845 [Aplysia californica]|uniref:Uncharacterized protein LOC101858845 n=1 Tax=Aplysia californica TaxID=6500 RepID=A0ABM0JHS0_APLCA|nr:uncharacterized protein LOC101858845 [Aplysia californica]
MKVNIFPDRGPRLGKFNNNCFVFPAGMRFSRSSWPFLPCLLLLPLTSSFDPDAGLVTSYTKRASASVTASSQPNHANLANDGDPATHWMSAGCMPGFYVRTAPANVLKDACSQGLCSLTGGAALASGKSDLVKVTDGDTGTGVQFSVSAAGNGNGVGGAAGSVPYLDVNLPTPQRVQYVTIRGRYAASTSLKLLDENSAMVEEFHLDAGDNYRTKDLRVSVSVRVKTVRFEVSAGSMLWELAALGEKGCVDHVTWDLGELSEVRVVKSRHWAGHHGLTTDMFVSADGLTWQHVASLDPNALGTVTTILTNTLTVRYIRVQHQYTDTDYAKVYMWELDAYDKDGEFGPAPDAAVNPTPLREMLGVNGIWGWGNNRYSDLLPAGQGPQLYSPVASHGRNYHNMDWDVTDPDVSADYSKMAAGGGTQAKSWLDWDKEYLAWARSNLTVHASLQFTADMFSESVWDNVGRSSRRYGEEFARHFGPSRGASSVKAAEVGNEPWRYPAAFYKTVLDNMAAGLKHGDPNILVLPGAFQADDKESAGNYIGTRVTETALPSIDVINFHHYSYVTGNDGVRRATFPEHPASSFNSLRNMLRWRDANAPHKPVWVTEWGWDSAGVGEACNFHECVSETAAAVYAKRGLLLHARHGVERSTWFFYGNLNDCDDHIYCRSGLTGSQHAGFAKKKTYVALQNLLSLLGHFHFLEAIREDDHGYVYAFGSPDAGWQGYVTSHLVAWQPVDAEHATVSSSNVTFYHHATPTAVFCDVSGVVSRCDERVQVDCSTARWTVELTAEPIVIDIRVFAASGLVG